MATKMFKYDEELKEALGKVYPDRELVEFLVSLRSPGKTVTLRVNTLKVRSLELVEKLRRRNINSHLHPQVEEAVTVPILGPYPLHYGRSLKKIYADKKASEAVYQGANLYAPGVLRCEEFTVGEEVVIASPTGEPVAVGVAKMNSEDVKVYKRGLVVEVKHSIYKAPKLRELPEYKEGLFYEQSIPSIIVGREVDPRPGELIVDMCAAPGGKTSHVLELSKLKARIIAFDHSKRRIEKMKGELSRLGILDYVEIFRRDSRYIDLEFPNLKADKVILDPPCSNLGVRPKLYDTKTYDQVLNLSNYQKQFLKVAWKILKPGGVLVYSTCTVTLEENEENIVYAIEELGFELGELKFENLGSKPLNPKLSGGALRFHPHHQDTPGYFIAKLVKP